MAEQFDVKLVDEAKYHTPRPEYREKAWVMDDKKEFGRFLKDPETFRALGREGARPFGKEG